MRNQKSIAASDQGIGIEERDDQGLLLQELFAFLSDWTGRFSGVAGDTDGSPDAPLMLNDRLDDLANNLILNEENKRGSIAVGTWTTISYAERRLRDRIFDDAELFGEPAWDILLDVAAAEDEGERLQVSAVCIGACVPSTTALRWLRILEERQLIRREDDEGDARRQFVRLTKFGAGKLETYFNSVLQLRRSKRLGSG